MPNLFCRLGDCPDAAPSLSDFQWARVNALKWFRHKHGQWPRWSKPSRAVFNPIKRGLSQRNGAAINTVIHHAGVPETLGSTPERADVRFQRAPKAKCCTIHQQNAAKVILIHRINLKKNYTETKLHARLLTVVHTLIECCRVIKCWFKVHKHDPKGNRTVLELPKHKSAWTMSSLGITKGNKMR